MIVPNTVAVVTFLDFAAAIVLTSLTDWARTLSSAHPVQAPTNARVHTLRSF
jgi:hypothetical protein